MIQSIKQPEGLIKVLLNINAEFGDRDDAAMDLGGFDEIEVEQALAKIACDSNVDEGLADSCGESLAEIWCRQSRLNEKVFLALTPAALLIALAIIEAQSPALMIRARDLLTEIKGARLE